MGLSDGGDYPPTTEAPWRHTRRDVLIAGGSAALTGAVTWLVTSFLSRGEAPAAVELASSPAVTPVPTPAATPVPEALPPAAPTAPAPLGLTVYQYQPARIVGLGELIEGQALPFMYPSERQTAVLLKLGEPAWGGVGPDGDVVAFSDICTHMGCPLGSVYDAEHKVLGPCPCHFTTFDLRKRGIVVLGQATDDLPQIELTVDAAGDIFATGIMGLVYGYRSNFDALTSVGVAK